MGIYKPSRITITSAVTKNHRYCVMRLQLFQEVYSYKVSFSYLRPAITEHPKRKKKLQKSHKTNTHFVRCVHIRTKDNKRRSWQTPCDNNQKLIPNISIKWSLFLVHTPHTYNEQNECVCHFSISLHSALSEFRVFAPKCVFA